MKLKKNFYIFSYIIFILVICTLNMLSVTDVLSPRLNLPLTLNPIYFLILDFLILFIIMKKLKKEPYILQQRVIEYFKSMNNLFLFLALLYSSSFLTIVVNMITNMFLVYLLRPMTADPSHNGVEEHFSKYHYNNKSYNSLEEVRDEYKKLENEVEVEIPGLEVEIKDKQKDKIRKIKNYALPIIILGLFLVGVVFSCVEFLKTFERGEYHYYDVTLNNEQIFIYYEEEYYNVVIPVVYTQKENKNFYTSQNPNDSKNEIDIQEKYILDLKEYECYNNDKGENVKVSCGHEALSETKKEIKLIKNEMTITYQDKIIYEGLYKKDVTDYLKEPGKYTFEIKNKRDKISSNIKFVINIKEKIVEE